MNLDKIREKYAEERRNIYLAKINACKRLLDIINQPLNELLEVYKNVYFNNSSINKKDLFQKVLQGNLSEDIISFLDKAGNVHEHQNDSRSYHEYAIDIILGWIIEDAIVLKLQKNNINAHLIGVDSNREFLKMDDIDSTPDIEVNNRLMDVFVDWTNFWVKSNGQADLRDFKYKKLEKEKALLLGLSPISQVGFLLDISNNSYGFEYNPSIIAYGGKSGYTTKELTKHLMPIDNVFDKLYSMFN